MLVKYITCKRYNQLLAEKKLGFVIRYDFGKYVVCDGRAPDTDAKTDADALFIGYAVKRCDTYEEADRIRNILNA